MSLSAVSARVVRFDTLHAEGAQDRADFRRATLPPDRFEVARPSTLQPLREAPAQKSPQNAFISFGPAFERALDDATATRVKHGNHIEPLFDGVASFVARRQLIENAKRSIHLQTFIFSDDQTGRQTVELLCDAARRGVKVRVIYDALGSNRADKAIFDTLRQAGVEVRAYGNPWTEPWTANRRWHEKLLVVDSEHAVTGGMNIADEYAFGGSMRLVRRRSSRLELPWRDVDVLVSGPLLRDLQLGFTSNWEKLGKGLLEAEMDALLAEVPLPRTTGSDVRFVSNDPHAAQNKIEDVLWYAITSAQSHVSIESAYFAPTKAIKDALLDAAARGVKVRILTNSPETNDLPVSQLVARHHYRELLAGGVQIFETKGGTLHSKTYSFDSVYSIVGSANLNRRSSKHDTESIACMRNQAMAKLLETRFCTGLKNAERMSEDLLDAQPWHAKAKQWAAATILGSFC
jgi:cardiolipin synthase A/B